MIPEPSASPPTVPAEQRAAPPTAPTGKVYERRKVWHKVIGIIGIVLSAGSLLGAIYSSASPMLYNSMEHTTASRAQAIGLGAANTLLAVVLLVGSIQLLQRRARSAATLLLWATGKTIAVLVGTLMLYTSTTGQLANMASAGGPFATSFVTFGAIFGVVFSLSFSLPLPVFTLIWFTRTGIKSDIASWKKTPDTQESAA